jgi:hypothetical protein
MPGQGQDVVAGPTMARPAISLATGLTGAQNAQIWMADGLIGFEPDVRSERGGSGAAVAPHAVTFRNRAGRLRAVPDGRQWADSRLWPTFREVILPGVSRSAVIMMFVIMLAVRS